MPGEILALTVSEIRKRGELEARIRDCLAEGRRQHFLIGGCLDEILQQRLYRENFASFDDYCQGVWGLSGSIGRKYANAFRVLRTLKAAEDQLPDVYWDMTTGLQPAHAAVLQRLPESVQPIAWSEARQQTVTPSVKALEEVCEKFQDQAQRIGSMTAEEEASFNAEVEAETHRTYRAVKAKEVAAWMKKRIASVIRAAKSESVSGCFDELVAKLEAIVTSLV